MALGNVKYAFDNIDWGKQLGQSALTYGLQALGSSFGPVGSFLGSSLGNFIGGKLFGSELPSRPRVNLQFDINNPFNLKLKNQKGVPGSYTGAVNRLGNLAGQNIIDSLYRLGITDPSLSQFQLGSFQSRAGFAIPQLGEGLYRNINIKGKAKQGRAFGPKGERVSVPTESTFGSTIEALGKFILGENVVREFEKNPSYFLPQSYIRNLGLEDRVHQKVPEAFAGGIVDVDKLAKERMFKEGAPKYALAFRGM